ncbi:MAG: DUF1080 domain-containing protein [Planctomycetaceae bacterium]|nr:DUF1080 domain-containing protein [Planctomycetaceae bacterium]
MRFNLLRMTWLIIVALWPTWHESAQGADEPLAKNSFPFPFEFVQGEYAGKMLVDDQWQTYGLQVVARGNGKFTANLLPGGLPSHENLNPFPTKLEGQVEGEHLVLKSNGGLKFHFQATPFYQFVQSDSSQNMLAQLFRVERYSATLNQPPPPNAIVLFNKGLGRELTNSKLTASGNLAMGASTTFPVGDFQLHVEFRLPFQPDKSNQDRGNSGIYMQRRYEVQILDSFGEPPVENNAGSIYKQRAAAGNVSLPPLVWQTYDIWFTAARWSEEGKKISPARVTVKHNGILIHDDVEISSKTGAGLAEGPEPQPILFQDHSDPVEFRNVWIIKGNL